MTDIVAPAAVEPAPAEPVRISLTEFCLRHSRIERSVELVNAFFTLESHAGRVLATEAEFVKRLGDFAARPTV